RCLRAFSEMMPHLVPNRQAMRDSALKGFATATDLADYLVRKGMPFRDAHEVVGKAVRLGIDTARDLSALYLEELKALAPMIEADVYEVLTLEGSLCARDHLGGTAPVQVRAAIESARKRLHEEVTR
ncbi:MAG: argininosuccinate lyase, partial [Methylococcaceae bacterium]